MRRTPAYTITEVPEPIRKLALAVLLDKAEAKLIGLRARRSALPRRSEERRAATTEILSVERMRIDLELKLYGEAS